jgi:hypothetical protein
VRQLIFQNVDSLDLIHSELSSSQRFYHYKIADAFYQSNACIPELEYLSHANIDNAPQIKSSRQMLKELTFNENSLIGDKVHPLSVYTDKHDNYQIKCNADVFNINKERLDLAVKKFDITLLMGPALILNLAINKVFCLHASAFVLNNKLFVLMAASGTGKSTIARFIKNQPECYRVADDIVPIKIINGKLRLLPSFPQLKLSNDQQYNGNDIEMETVLLFANKSKDVTALKKTHQMLCLKNLIKHTVATKLFNENELRGHLHFCHQVSRQTKTFLLDYQHATDSLTKLVDLLYEA